MPKVTFPFDSGSRSDLGLIRRPIAQVQFYSSKFKKLINISMLVDTGADYTLLPRSTAQALGIDLKRDCKTFSTFGVGGKEKVYVLKHNIEIIIGDIHMKIPLGFLERDDIPPLLGRFQCLESLELSFSKFATTFSNS